jgi:hypothetical protein
MATRNFSGVELRRVPLDANRPRTHPKHSGRKAMKVREPIAERRDVSAEGDVLERLSRSISLVETIAVAMQAHEDDPELGPIAEALDVACVQLRQAHGAVDLALREVAS